MDSNESIPVKYHLFAEIYYNDSGCGNEFGYILSHEQLPELIALFLLTEDYDHIKSRNCSQLDLTIMRTNIDGSLSYVSNNRYDLPNPDISASDFAGK